jgi:hypothetical protein
MVAFQECSIDASHYLHWQGTKGRNLHNLEIPSDELVEVEKVARKVPLKGTERSKWLKKGIVGEGGRMGAIWLFTTT